MRSYSQWIQWWQMSDLGWGGRTWKNFLGDHSCLADLTVQWDAIAHHLALSCYSHCLCAAMEKPTDELCVGNPLIAIGVLSHSSLTQLTQLLQGYNTLYNIYIYYIYTFNIIRHLLSQLQLFHWKRCRCNSCSFALTCFDIPGLPRPQSAVSHPAERPWPCKSWSPAVVWNNLKHEKIIKDLYWPRWRRCDKTNFRLWNLWILRIGSSFHTSSSLDIIVMWANGMMELGNSWRLWWHVVTSLRAKYISILQANTTQGTPKFVRTECAWTTAFFRVKMGQDGSRSVWVAQLTGSRSFTHKSSLSHCVTHYILMSTWFGNTSDIVYCWSSYSLYTYISLIHPSMCIYILYIRCKTLQKDL